jgi:hypothetical protein
VKVLGSVTYLNNQSLMKMKSGKDVYKWERFIGLINPRNCNMYREKYETPPPKKQKNKKQQQTRSCKKLFLCKNYFVIIDRIING